MKNIEPRLIAASEATVIRDALVNASLSGNSSSMVEQLESLKVVGECECGCRSLYFRSIEKNDYRVADGVGYLPDGERVGVMVWSTFDGSLAALEIDDHGGAGLLPSNVCSWEEAGKREAAK